MTQPEIVGQVVKVDVRKSEYESTTLLQRQIQQRAAARAAAVEQTVTESTTVMSSFKPSSNTQKIYASPQEVNITANNNDVTNNNINNYGSTVNHSKIITNNIINNNNNTEHYKSTSEHNVTKVVVTASSGNLNPYAQPGVIGIEPQTTKAPTVMPNKSQQPPMIPEPDYSESDEEESANNSVKLATNVQPFSNESVNTLKRNDNQKIKDDNASAIVVENENSGNSSTGNSSSVSVSHSYSVDEIQKIRSALKSSKTFPNANQNNQNNNINASSNKLMPQLEDRENSSSSGVSSDQEFKGNTSRNSPANNYTTVTSIATNNRGPQVNPLKKDLIQNNVAVSVKKESIVSTEDAPSDEDSPPLMAFQRNNSLTRKQASILAANRAKVLAQTQGQVVSLAQLPPPLEADSDEELDNCKEASYIGKSRNN